MAELVSLDDLGIEGDPVEDGETFETNAAIKARFGLRAERPADAGRRFGHRGRRAGRRARACGRGAMPARTRRTTTTTRKLLAALAGLPPERRGARYVCVLALALPGDAGPRGGVRADH